MKGSNMEKTTVFTRILARELPAAIVYEDGREVARRWHHNFLWSRALTISGGSSEIMRGLIGRQLLGLPRA